MEPESAHAPVGRSGSAARDTRSRWATALSIAWMSRPQVQIIVASQPVSAFEGNVEAP